MNNCNTCAKMIRDFDGGQECVAPFDSPALHRAMLEIDGLGCEYYEVEDIDVEMILLDKEVEEVLDGERNSQDSD